MWRCNCQRSSLSFTGQYVPLKETLRGFKMILSGECDELPESAFLFAGTIDDVFAKAKKG